VHRFADCRTVDSRRTTALFRVLKSGPANQIASEGNGREEKEILEEHLPYELDMFEDAFLWLNADEYTEQRKENFLKNAAIESFWVHARNLIEFFAQPKNADAGGTVSAKDFTGTYYPNLNMRTLDTEINEQICHLRYDREKSDLQKLSGWDMLRVKQTIDREIKNFEQALTPESRAIWIARNPSGWVSTEGLPSCTNTTRATLSVIDVAKRPKRNAT
jgi:hypothetical protein